MKTMELFPDEINGYRKLLLSVVWLAVHDACASPVHLARSDQLFPSEDASTAIHFIFGSDRPFFKKYMMCLDMDAETFRSKLLLAMYGDESGDTPFQGLPHNAKKSFRFNHSHWLQNVNRYVDVYAGE